MWLGSGKEGKEGKRLRLFRVGVGPRWVGFSLVQHVLYGALGELILDSAATLPLSALDGMVHGCWVMGDGLGVVRVRLLRFLYDLPATAKF